MGKSEIGRRVREVRVDAGITMTEFAKRIKISVSGVSKIESGENFPSKRTLSIIENEFNIRSEWLQTGVGEMHRPREMIPVAEIVQNHGLVGEEAQLAEKFLQLYFSLRPETRQDILANFNLYFGNRILDLPRTEEIIPIIMYDLHPAAGVGSYTPEGDVPYTTIQAPKSEVPPGTDFCVVVGGDSMEPDFPDQSRAYIRRAEEAQSGDVVIASLNGEMYLKQLIIDEGGTTLHSINMKYPDIPVFPVDNFRIFGIAQRREK